MKKLFTIAILGLLSTGVFAQTSKGTLAVSGDLSLSFSSNDQKEYNHVVNRTSISRITGTDFRFEPGIGYFIKDNLKVNAFIGYGLNNNEYVTNNQSASGYKTNSKEHIYKIGASLQKYYMLSDKFAFTASGVVAFNTGKRKGNNNSESSFETDLETTGLYAGLTPGIVFFPSEKIGIGTGFGFLGYRTEKTTHYYETSTYESSFASLGLDLRSSTWGVNFSYYFNR